MYYKKCYGNIFKHSTVLVFNLFGNLFGRGVVENGSTVQVGPTEHIVDDLESFMHTSSCPTCRIYGREVVAMVDMSPGDELTYNPINKPNINSKALGRP